MKELIKDLRQFFSEDVCLVKNLSQRESEDESPEETRWSLQMIVFDGRKWTECMRIDNHLHQGKTGSHIHYPDGRVKSEPLGFREAETRIKVLCSRLLQGMHDAKVDTEDE